MNNPAMNNNGLLQGNSVIGRDVSLVMPVRRASLSFADEQQHQQSLSNTAWPEYYDHSRNELQRRDEMLVMPVRRQSLSFADDDDEPQSLLLLPEHHGCKKKASVPTTRSISFGEGGTIIKNPPTETVGVIKKCVRFAPERSNATIIIMGLDDYTSKEHEACWYTLQELDTMMMLHHTSTIHRDTRWNAGATLDHMYDSKMWSKNKIAASSKR